MTQGTLARLPPLKKSQAGVATPASKLNFFTPQHKKSTFTVPKMKQVAKLAEAMGKTVTAFTVNADGGFTVTVSGSNQEDEPNPFDEVLK